MRLQLTGAICLCLLASGCDSRPDKERIQGEWQLWKMNGWFDFDLPAVKGGPTKIVFVGDQFTFMNAEGPGQRVSGTFSCDQGKRLREITFRFADRTIVATCSVSGSTMHLSFGMDDRAPPATLAGGPGERPALLVFQRPKSE